MPNPIDRCAACHQPLYVEDNIAGGCACNDRDFRILLAQQRHRNNTGNEDFASAFVASSAPPDLTDVDPGILMSAAGRSEYEGAQQVLRPLPNFRQAAAEGLRGGNEVAVMFDDAAFFPEARSMADTNPNVSSPRQDQPVEPVDDEIELGGEDDWTGTWEDRPRHQARVASVAARMDGVDLAAMWMQGTGIPFDRSQLVAPGGDGFEFDTGEMAIDTAYPRGGGAGGGRFRVDQAPPARPGFNRATVGQASGVEVSRVRGGRFEVIRERPAAAPRPNIFDQVRAEMAGPPPAPEPVRAAPMTAVQQARALQAKPRGPSVYDRLRSNPFNTK